MDHLAAHCIADVTLSGNDFVRVMFTDTSKNLFELSFRCGASTTPMPGGSELLALGCDNDGSIF